MSTAILMDITPPTPLCGVIYAMYNIVFDRRYDEEKDPIELE